MTFMANQKRKSALARPACSTKYAVEWRKVNGKWERLVSQRDNEAQALKYARRFFKDWLEKPKLRCIEIKHSERIL